MEHSFFLLAVLYGLVALLLPGEGGPASAAGGPWTRWAPAAAFAVAFAFFPFGQMEGYFLTLPARRMADSPDIHLVTVREGRTETILWLREDLFGEPVCHRLVTNNFGMSATRVFGRRYMKLYVYWPVALRPDPKQALLISYGVGSTAKALTDTRSLEHIDVVDISREILEMSSIVFTDPSDNPLNDPRVRVHVEDARYFLQTTEEYYDLITAEPPPPEQAGVVNLYTQEYFQLIHERLTEGGICTYWLPVHAMTKTDALGVIRAFCEVFQDGSLWVGYGLDWMLVGSRDAGWTPSEEGFARQWADPVVQTELQALGLERPEQLGALFLADAPYLREITRQTPPVVDDYPKRLAKHAPGTASRGFFLDWMMDTEGARTRFRSSEFIREAWPAELRQRTLPYFDHQQTLNRISGSFVAPIRDVGRHMASLHSVLTGTTLRTPALWEMRITDDELRIARRMESRGELNGTVLRYLGVGALAERQYTRASEYLARAHEAQPRDPFVVYYWLYALCFEGRVEEAGQVARSVAATLPPSDAHQGYLAWMKETFGLGD